MLYDSNVITKETNVILIADSEETLMIEEESRSKRFWLLGNFLSIKNDLRKFKGKDIVDNAAQVSNATTIAPGMYKLDLIVEQAKSLNPLDGASYSALPKTKGSISKPKIAKSVISNKSEPGTSWGSNTSVAPSSSSSINLSFLGTVKFSNDQIATIMEYGDYQIGNITISRVYYVEGLGHNLFFVGQFCDSDLEVAFRKHACFVRNVEGVDLLSGS
ncbi:hypothetical protein Tco_0629688 [Tanacetum coccineum]|uniref:Integrase, catalytic region, zinc finger, CCHC-type, peptidase aspartic, catalytic n=1 Tax=Tanacetum coccineum TaxID=301880 RepID=A0ABQ4WUI8_9ASTR